MTKVLDQVMVINATNIILSKSLNGSLRLWYYADTIETSMHKDYEWCDFLYTTEPNRNVSIL